VRFINLILREVFFRAGIYERRIDFLRFLSVGVLDRFMRVLHASNPVVRGMLSVDFA